MNPASGLRQAVAGLRRIPFSASLSVALLVAGIVLNTLLFNGSRLPGRNAAFHAHDLLTTRWWSFLSSVFFTGNPAQLLLAIAFVLAALGLAERTMGTARTVVAFFGTQLAAVVLFTVIVEISDRLDVEWLASMDDAVMLGPFAGVAGALMAASPMISVLWRRRLQSLAIAVALMLLLYVGHAQNLLVLLGVLSGLLLGLVLVPHPGTAHIIRSSSHESRTTLAIVVAVFAAGPLMAAIAYAPVGPLAVLRNVIINPLPTLAQMNLDCPPGVRLTCGQLIHGAGMVGPGRHLMALVPMLLLLACAEGLRRGSRMALWVTIFAHLTIGVASFVYLQVFTLLGLPLRRGSHTLSMSSSVIELLPVVLVPFLIALALFLNRRHFTIDVDPQLRRRTVALLLLALGGFIGLYAIAWFAEGNYNAGTGIMGFVAGLPRLLLPYPFPVSYGIDVYPQGFFSTLLFSLGGAVFWLFCVLSVLLLFLSRRIGEGPARHDRATAKELVMRGGGSLSWMALWPGNSYWFNEARTVGVAYQAHFGVAVTVAGPFGEPGDVEGALGEFAHFCADQSLTPCFYSVADDHWGSLAAMGFRRAAVAEETLLDIQDMEFKGKEWQNVRTALNKARRLGISAQWFHYSQLPATLRTQIHEISEEWVSEKALPEMGFTLGGVQELRDDNVLICLAVDADQKVHGITSWLPVHSAGVVESWTLDFMRRNSGAFNGVMEFLIAEAVSHFRDQTKVISLSGSPLAHTEGVTDEPQGPGDATMQALLRLLGRALEPVYGFQSLAAFKRRFQPRHRTLYMMYQDPLALPSIGRAVGEAYMPNLSVRQSAKLLREVVG
ncbi:bifunctional lysylphosphatidylglycerol flippase/synthetase MprF [Specibacter cremeus]|uniref:bifunctional lysylphosphatidylglycerol flippase/synthetase MprF n=1 Tax=Specibacter cremeus TaxID=1629051 RepID=UPI000F772ECD|nr:phosphatidylglycerol lysyltransferase domain-containing protein [Specibacter cremeus]